LSNHFWQNFTPHTVQFAHPNQQSLENSQPTIHNPQQIKLNKILKKAKSCIVIAQCWHWVAISNQICIGLPHQDAIVHTPWRHRKRGNEEQDGKRNKKD
jgi:hypothetical protein